jgi:hypothetical protein
MITIEGIINTAATGGYGAAATYSGGGGGGVVGGRGCYPSGSCQYGGSDALSYNYSTPQSYVYTMLQFLGDEWQRYVLGRTLPTYVGATYLAGYGAGGGQGYSGAGGGGGQGGEIIIYMHNLYAPTITQIIAMGGTGGYASGTIEAAGGGGGAGGLVYIITHNMVAFSGTINVNGGIGMTGVAGAPVSGTGAPNTFAIFIV